MRWNYFAAGDYVSADAAVERAPAPSRRTVRGRHVPRGWHHLPDDERPRLQGDPRDWATQKGGPTDAPDGHGLHVLRAPRAADAREEGLHDARLPLAGDGSRLSTSRRQRWALRASRDAAQLRALARPGRARFTRSEREPHSPQEPRSPSSPNPAAPAHAARHSASRRRAVRRRRATARTTDRRRNDGDLDAENRRTASIRDWIGIERGNRMKDARALSAIVYVKRPLARGPDAPQDFEAFAPGADLMSAPRVARSDDERADRSGRHEPCSAAVRAQRRNRRAPSGRLLGRHEDRVLRAEERGRAVAHLRHRRRGLRRRADHRRGAGRRPGQRDRRRTASSSTTSIRRSRRTGASCSPRRAATSRTPRASTIKARSGRPRIRRRLNANLYVLEDVAGTPQIRQLTFLLEPGAHALVHVGRAPHHDDREARQRLLSARRSPQNLDGGDYHPLFGQRATIGYRQVTDVVELAGQELRGHLQRPGDAHGAGTLGIVNRSLGVDQHSDDPGGLPPGSEGHRPGRIPTFTSTRCAFSDGQGRRVPKSDAASERQILVSYARGCRDSTNFDGTSISTSSMPSPATHGARRATTRTACSGPSRLLRALQRRRLRVEARRTERRDARLDRRRRRARAPTSRSSTRRSSPA